MKASKSAPSFDTSETYIYKLAYSMNTPVEYIHVEGVVTNNPKYTDVDALIRTAINEDVPLSSIAQYLDVLGVHDSIEKIKNIQIDVGIKKLNLDPTQLTRVKSKELRDLINKVEQFLKDEGRVVKRPGSYDIKHYQNEYMEYIETFKKSLEQTKRIAEEIEEVHKAYANALVDAPLLASNMRLITEDLKLVVVDDTIDSRNILSVFDSVELSSHIRHVVCYASADVTYQKVYKGVELTLKDTVDLDQYKFVQGEGISVGIAQIVFTVNVGAVYVVVYNLDAKYMTVSVKSYDKEKILDAITKSFPHVEYIETSVSITSQVRLYPVKDNTFSMMFHYLLHRSVVSPSYYQFFLNESTSPYPKKTNLKLRYRPYWTSSGFVAKKEEAYAIVTTPQTALGSNYIEITLTGQTVMSMWRMLSSFIPAINMYYKSDIIVKSSLAPLYNDKIQGLVDVVKKPAKKHSKEQLHDEWPQVFSKLYVSSVEPKNMVKTTTNPDVVDEWESEKISVNGHQYIRQVKPFPEHGKTLFWFTSVNKSSPYVGYAANIHDEDPLYPTVPYSAPSLKALETKRNATRRGTESKSTSIPYEAVPGTEVLNELIGVPIVRFGMSSGPDSVLKAISLFLLNGSTDDKLISKQAKLIRAKLLTYTPSLYKQELYDWTDEAIMKGLNDKLAYFDPLLYMAGLVELTNRDIYVVSVKLESNVRVHRLETPRHSQYYTGNKDSRECLVLCMNYGIKSDTLMYPQCELVVADDYESIYEGAVFDSTISQRLKNIYEICNPQVPYYNLNSYKCMYTMSSMNNIVERMFTFGYILVSQYIDPYGKARVFTFEKEDVEPLSLFCSPCPPMNILTSNVIHSTHITVFEDVMGSKCVGRSDLGVWCVERTTGALLYARLDIVPKYLVRIGNDPIVSDFTTTLSGKAASVDRKSAAILSNLVRWLFEVYCHERRMMNKTISQSTVTSFVETFLTYASPPILNYTYNIDIVDEKLPHYLTTAEVLKYLSSVFIVENKTIVLHNKAYFDSLSYNLSKNVKRAISGDYVELEPTYIENFYTSIYDFKVQPETLILSGLIDPHANASRPEIKNTILQSLLPEHSHSETPLLYLQHGTKHSVLYVVQSTQLGKIGSALKVCEVWDETHVNSGFSTTGVVTRTDKNVVIYIIVAGRLVEHSYIQHGADTKEMYEIVMYDVSVGRLHGRYGALLRLSSINDSDI